MPEHSSSGAIGTGHSHQNEADAGDAHSVTSMSSTGKDGEHSYWRKPSQRHLVRQKSEFNDQIRPNSAESTEGICPKTEQVAHRQRRTKRKNKRSKGSKRDTTGKDARDPTTNGTSREAPSGRDSVGSPVNSSHATSDTSESESHASRTMEAEDKRQEDYLETSEHESHSAPTTSDADLLDNTEDEDCISRSRSRQEEGDLGTAGDTDITQRLQREDGSPDTNTCTEEEGPIKDTDTRHAEADAAEGLSAGRRDSDARSHDSDAGSPRDVPNTLHGDPSSQGTDNRAEEDAIKDISQDSDADVCGNTLRDIPSRPSLNGSLIGSDQRGRHDLDLPATSVPVCPEDGHPFPHEEPSDICRLGTDDGKELYAWDPNEHGSNITIDDWTPNTFERAQAGQMTDGAKGIDGYTEGRHVFELTFTAKSWGSHCCVAICTDKAAMQREGYVDLFGQDPHSWAWDIPSRSLMHKGECLGKWGDHVTEIPNVIGLILDLAEGTLALDIGDGSPPSTVFTGLGECGEMLYPAVSVVYPHTEVTIRKVSKIIGVSEPTLETMARNTPTPSKETEIKNEPEGSEESHNYGSLLEHHQDEGTRSMEPSDENSEASARGDSSGPPTAGTEPGFDNFENTEVTNNVCVRDYVSSTSAEPLEGRAAENGDEWEDTVEVSSLSEDDQYLLRVAHGWDGVLKGSRVQLHPGIPYICIPASDFGEKFQAIRSRKGVTHGKHRWRMRELVWQTPRADGSQDTSARNNLVVGMMNGEHRTFNYGFSLSQIGRHAWGWESGSGLFWHASSRLPFPVSDFSGDGAGMKIEIDLRKGIDLVFSGQTRMVSFEHDEVEYPVNVSMPMFGRDFYPFILFKGRGVLPMTIEYISGPREHLENTLAAIRKLRDLDIEDFVNFRSMSSQLVATTTISTLDEKHVTNFSWGLVSPGVNLSPETANEVTFTSKDCQAAVTSFPLSSNKHTIDVLSQNIDKLTIGFAGASSPSELVAQPWTIGSNLDSWGWKVTEGHLVHAGTCLGRYPFNLKETADDPSNMSHVRLCVAFSATGSGSVSFATVSPSGGTIDHGIAFVNLASPVWLVVTGAAGEANEPSKVTLNYRSGPQKFVVQLESMTSRVCDIL